MGHLNVSKIRSLRPPVRCGGGHHFVIASRDHSRRDLASDNEMSVSCIGDTSVMEQLGEKQDFELQLSQLGFRHEDFKLHVGQAQSGDGESVGAGVYAVDLIHVITAKSKIYWGGRGANWVAKAGDDLARGLFGAPPARDVPT